MRHSRRTVVASALGLLGGCAGSGGFGASSSTRTRTATGEPEPTESTPSPTPEPVHAGRTISPVSHPESRGPPLAPGPLPGVENPVLTPDDVTDFGDVSLVADPFLFVEEGEWHLFVEVYNEDRDPDAAIGHARSSDGRDWEYTGVVLEKDAHTSFPLV